MISRTVKGPWCEKGIVDYHGNEAWFVYYLPYVCDDFWKHFDWVRPKTGEEMRFVLSNVEVRGAQKTVIRNGPWNRQVVVNDDDDPDTDLWLFPSMRADLLEIEPRVLFEFNVWWWLEYRKGEMK